MFERKSSCPANTRHLYNIYTSRPNVLDAGPTLHKVIQMFCVYWVTIQAWGASSFQIPAVIQSVCLQVDDQVGAKVFNFCAAHSPVRLDIEPKFPISYFGHACPK